MSYFVKALITFLVTSVFFWGGILWKPLAFFVLPCVFIGIYFVLRGWFEKLGKIKGVKL